LIITFGQTRIFQIQPIFRDFYYLSQIAFLFSMPSANDPALDNTSAVGVANEKLAIKNDLANLMEGSSQAADQQVQDMDLKKDEADSGYSATNDDEEHAIDDG
jgi:hypothetical protein